VRAIADGRYEAYNGGQRIVQYFDEARMEINNVQADRSSPWFVSNGLLVSEMIAGRIQTGDQTYETRAPNEEALAGDPRVVNPDAPSYATLAMVLPAQNDKTGQAVRAQLLRNGTLRDITPPAAVSVCAICARDATQHPRRLACFSHSRV
jgi:hypothetical protein